MKRRLRDVLALLSALVFVATSRPGFAGISSATSSARA
jgi:hypothetical protein